MSRQSCMNDRSGDGAVPAGRQPEGLDVGVASRNCWRAAPTIAVGTLLGGVIGALMGVLLGLLLGILMGPASALAAQAAPLAPAATEALDDPAALRRGEQVYSRCVACHAIEANRTGPQHCGLFGRQAGTAPGYDAYSPAMRHAKIVWDDRSLDRFLQAPTEFLPGTAMGYAGVKDARERADLIAWLRVATRAGEACAVAR